MPSCREFIKALIARSGFASHRQQFTLGVVIDAFGAPGRAVFDDFAHDAFHDMGDGRRQNLLRLRFGINFQQSLVRRAVAEFQRFKTLDGHLFAVGQNDANNSASAPGRSAELPIAVA